MCVERLNACLRVAVSCGTKGEMVACRTSGAGNVADRLLWREIEADVRMRFIREGDAFP